MPPPETPTEAPRDPIHIVEENAISLEEALKIARAENVPLGKSTLQRWALKWKGQHALSPVKSVLWVSNDTKTYFLDLEDFKAWIFDRKQNMRPNETLRDPEGPGEASQDLKRPSEASRDPERSPPGEERDT